MKTIKSKLVLSILFLQCVAQAQFSAGAKLNFSTGNIGSQNLTKNLDYQLSISPDITEWGVKRRWGLGIGFGGFVAYNFSERFSILLEPTIDFLKCGIDFKRVENNLDGKGNGDIKTESTTSNINLAYFNLPLLARYSVTKNNFFVEAGLGINFTGVPTITSTSNSQKDNYNNGVLDKTIIDPSYTLQTKLNVFSSPRVNFIFGLGKSFDINGKALTIDVRYSLPLTKSEMFTTDGNYNDGRFQQNDLLGINGKIDAERNAPYLLNDFKMSTITLSVSYTIFKQVKS